MTTWFEGNGGFDLLTCDFSKLSRPILAMGTTSTGYVSIDLGFGRVTARKVDALDITGSKFDDVISGFRNDDIFIGHVGNDQLSGDDGDDTLDGGLGLDQLSGGKGADSLRGGDGADVFVFNTTLASDNVDTISDFTVNLDKLHLSDTQFGGLTPGALDANALTVGPTATAAEHRIVYDDTTGALYFDADGDGATAQLQFATLGVGLALTEADFLVI